MDEDDDRPEGVVVHVSQFHIRRANLAQTGLAEPRTSGGLERVDCRTARRRVLVIPRARRDAERIGTEIERGGRAAAFGE